MKRIALILVAALVLSLAFACTTTPNVTPSPAGTSMAPSPGTGTVPPAASPGMSPAASPGTSPGGAAQSPGNSPGASPGASPATSPGEGLTASAKGYGGDVTATLSLADGNIGMLTLSGPNETEGIGKAALDTYNKMLADMKDKPLSEFDPSKLDVVSGATVTCEAAKTALKDVMSKAK